MEKKPLIQRPDFKAGFKAGMKWEADNRVMNASGWLPIKTAKKDGTLILAILDFKDRHPRELCIVKWTGGSKFPWECGDPDNDFGAVRKDIPTHWCPIPAMPKRK